MEATEESRGRTKEKLRRGEPALGAWIMIGHPTVAEVLAGEGFDWIAVDMEHTPIDLGAFHQIALAVSGRGVDLLVRLPSNDPVLTKRVLDCGADGIIVPSVCSPEEARAAVAMARFPPAGIRGASLSRASDFGRRFEAYFHGHNERVIVVVMLESAVAAERADEILAVEGIDAAFIGPYDLSASLGMAGELGRAEVAAAVERILEACRRRGVPAGIHVVSVDPGPLRQRIAAGFRFIACGVDTLFLQAGCREILRGREGRT